MSNTYSHQYCVAFTVNSSTHPEGDDVTADQMRVALEQRIADIDSEGDLEWGEAAQLLDTVEEQ